LLFDSNSDIIGILKTREEIVEIITQETGKWLIYVDNKEVSNTIKKIL